MADSAQILCRASGESDAPQGSGSPRGAQLVNHFRQRLRPPFGKIGIGVPHRPRVLGRIGEDEVLQLIGINRDQRANRLPPPRNDCWTSAVGHLIHNLTGTPGEISDAYGRHDEFSPVRRMYIQLSHNDQNHYKVLRCLS